MPQRIQRKREKGWRIPAGVVSVTRPGRFGNPFAVTEWGLELSLQLFRETVGGGWNPALLEDFSDERFNRAYELRCGWLKGLGGHHPEEIIRSELRGKDLACWCPLGQPCHADVLLEVANR